MSKGDSAWPYWKDINGDGLKDLFLLSQLEGKLLVYQQSSLGLATEPNQIIELPEDTGWCTVFEVNEQLGDEIIISTSSGLLYYRQNNGVFEEKPRELVRAEQIFSGNIWPIFFHREMYSDQLGKGLPIIFNNHSVIYELDANDNFKAGRRVELEPESEIEKEVWRSWSLGAKESSGIRIRNKMQDRIEKDEKEESAGENETIRKLIEGLRKNNDWYRYGIEEKDVNGDGREDLVLWYSKGNIEVTTIVRVFVRAEDDKLPEKADQILRLNGMPIRRRSIFMDINGDGLEEIVLVKLKKMLLSAESILEAMISKGLDCVLTIRSYRLGKGYSKKADFKLDVTTGLPINRRLTGYITFDGDFNNDGKTDIIIKRSSSQSDIYLSMPGEGYYNRKPQIQLDKPGEGHFVVEELNGDGISDIYVINFENNVMTIFLSSH
ncbi:MAG: FG-GAP repeat domain-containing protein [Planctomycetota bacterium]